MKATASHVAGATTRTPILIDLPCLAGMKLSGTPIHSQDTALGVYARKSMGVPVFTNARKSMGIPAFNLGVPVFNYIRSGALRSSDRMQTGFARVAGMV
jgi:hypothetical protein